MMQRILVIGSPGAGKSTLSRALAKRLGLPLFHLDLLYHKPDRTTVSHEEFDTALCKILAGERWIIDGNYGRTMETRLSACDTVLLLDYPTELCLAGIYQRIGKPRPDMPWQETEFDPEFYTYVKQFSSDRLPGIYALLERFKHEKQVHIFRTRAEADAFL